MDVRKSKVISIMLMNMLSEETGRIIESEIDKGDDSDFTMVD